MRMASPCTISHNLHASSFILLGLGHPIYLPEAGAVDAFRAVEDSLAKTQTDPTTLYQLRLQAAQPGSQRSWQA